MRKLLWNWLILVVAIVVASWLTGMLVPGFQLLVEGPLDVLKLFLGAALLGLLNATLGKVLKWGTAPITCLTFGLFLLVVNAFVLWLAGLARFGFEVEGPLAALLGSIAIAVVSSLLGKFVQDDKGKED